MRFDALILVLGLLFSSSLALSESIMVSPQIIDFSAGKRVENITVINSGDKRTFVKITPYRLEDPETPNEKRISEQNPQKLGLLVSPQHLIIPPRGEKTVRLIRLTKSSGEELPFLVSVTPVLGNVSAKNTNAIKIVIAYGVRIFLMPNQIKEKIVLEHHAEKLIVKNEGNVSAVLFSGKACVSESSCESLPAFRLYPDKSRDFRLKANAKVVYKVDYPKENIVELSA
ncbi:MAG: hypothetical protein COV52_07525 [Gammaproteobacteria bacterium CG11_big_fil_rev_8_21_14_0_20_46_22]|nr:MAG: hypothetical protein COW05_06765 [Gammaproteobacteria bacterium CG12_big_fil_rev_8_21_14_0_65_46_12]PIR10732.1 MAG: hypothetical protein COV52_07525 [Gammaproteobacteria bacterium CG11_big_fil_rev_8_21_14_0_20_46_22]